SAGAREPGENPTFTWDPATDVTTGVDHYELFIDKVKNRNVPLSACAASACTAQGSAALPEGDHSWQVKAVDAVGNARSSEERAITIGGAPSAAFTISPNPALAVRTVTSLS